MDKLQALLLIFQVFLAFCNTVLMIFVFIKFLSKPHITLESRVNEHDVKIKDIENSLKQGNDRFRDHEDTNEVMQICMLAIIDFELSFCAQTNYANTEDLIHAKELLRKHLARKREI